MSLKGQGAATPPSPALSFKPRGAAAATACSPDGLLPTLLLRLQGRAFTIGFPLDIGGGNSRTACQSSVCTLNSQARAA